jgi:2-succinyl-5-enolpyruvyl-6-hydroxy-3-cyclohexene-1-carboxylate synthase
MTASTPENLLTAWAGLLFDSLAAAGVERVIVSPGSRSTPFVSAAAANPKLRMFDVIDERGAGFFALGQARATGRPSLLLCTSGTAGAHYLPAVLEADQSGVPLVVMTADRPWELLHVGANQTIDQRLLFEGYARRVVDLGAPDAALPALQGLRRIAAQAVALSLAPVPGAVHLNVRARKPLEPVTGETPAAKALAATVRELCERPVPKAGEGKSALSADDVEMLASECVRAERGVIVAGPAGIAQTQSRDAITALRHATGFPLLAEAASQLRFAGHENAEHSARIDGFDWLYQLPPADLAWRPDLIIQLGAAPTSGAWERLLDRHPTIRRMIIAEWGWPDPHNTAAGVFHASIETACAQLAEAIAKLRPDSVKRGPAFGRALAGANGDVQRIVDDAIGASGEKLTEGAVARTAVASLPPDAWLVLGNSLPVRVVDAYCPGPHPEIRVVSQRGVSGIDGLIAGAAGVGSVADDAVMLLVGDISFLHDIGSLALGAAVRAPLVIVVLNNGGGRIFEQLPIARDAGDALMRHFTTPQNLDFEHAARLYRHGYARADNRPALAAALADALRRGGCTIIDAIVPPHNVAEEGARIIAALKRIHGG